MTVIDRYLKLKKNVEEAEREANQAEGALGQIMKQLKSEFNCATLATATKKYKELQKQVEVAERSFSSEVKKFNEKWQDKLGESDD